MHLYFLFFFLFLTTTINGSSKEPIYIYCSDDLHPSPSIYKSMVKILLSNLTSSTPKSPFQYSVFSFFGLFGFAQCRPDASQITCTECLRNSYSNLANANGCDRSISAILYQDVCLLRYSNSDSLFSLDHGVVGSSWSFVNSSNPSDFGRRVTELMVRISWEASMAMEKFAVGVAEEGAWKRQKKIYGMAWCILNLTRGSCIKCLLSAVPKLPYTTEGGRLFRFSCLLRFEVYMFFDHRFIKNKTLRESDDAAAAAVAHGDARNEF